MHKIRSFGMCAVTKISFATSGCEIFQGKLLVKKYRIDYYEDIKTEEGYENDLWRKTFEAAQ